MIRKIVLGVSLALATAMGSVLTTASAQAGPLARVIGAAGAVAKGDLKGVEDFAHGLRVGQAREGAKKAVKDVIFGAQIGTAVLKGTGGGGFGN
jgi:hypothetical protein